MFRSVIPGSTSRLALVDHKESYGRHVLENFAKSFPVETCIDLGCGSGDDLSIVAKFNPNAKLTGVDFGDWNTSILEKKKIRQISIDIESEKLPFEDETIDLIIANQVLEHTKEVFWINSEVFRCLKIGGVFFIGMPNILSLHNRMLMSIGYHPTQHKLSSAHVRPFSKKDVMNFYRDIGAEFSKIEGFWGSQFYPFPKFLARPLSVAFPSLSFSIFFAIKKTTCYSGEFLKWPRHARLETNFFTGD